MTNKITFDYMMTKADELGEQAGRGEDVQVRSLLQVLEGAYHGALDLKANKHGIGRDDSTVFAERYFKAKAGATSFNAKSETFLKMVSYSRTLTRLGSWPKGGPNEPLQSVGTLMTTWQKEAKIPGNRKNMKDATNTLLDFARAQIRRDTLIGDAEMKDICYKPVGHNKTPEQVLKEVQTKLDNLIKGTAGNKTAQDYSPEVLSAKKAVDKRLSELSAAKLLPVKGGTK